MADGLRYRFDKLDQLRDRFDPRIVEKAVRSSIRKTALKLRTKLSKRVRERYNVPARVIARHAKLENFFQSRSQPFSILRYVGSKIGLINFGARSRIVRTAKGKRRGVSVQVLKEGGRKVVKSEPAFIATGANENRHVFARTGEGRFPIVSLKGPSVAEMVGRDEVIDDANAFMSGELPRIFDNEMEFFLLRKVGLR